MGIFGRSVEVFRLKGCLVSKSSRKPLVSVTKNDLDVQTFRSGGHGGQRQNKVETGVRIIHRASGAVGESREHAKQYQNKKAAFRRMAEHVKFRIWMNEQVHLALGGKSPEEVVEEQMMTKNLRIERRNEEDRWVVWEERKS